jgi:hypothetical protein
MASDNPLGRNTIASDPRINPAIPDSVGGLLAEEWTINPRSTLPSFLERMMMEEARRSGWVTLRSIFAALEGRISRMVIDGERQVFNETNGAGGVEEIIKRLYFTLFRLWPIRVVKAFFRKVFQPFGPEIRLLLLYTLERGSLMHSDASISEALYGGKRSKLLEIERSNKHERSLRPLEKHDSVRLAFFLAFGPYLEERSRFFFQHFLELCSSSSPGRPSTATDTKKQQLKKILHSVWPLFRMTTKGLFFWYRWRYLLGRSVFFDPYSSLLNVVVRRTTMGDRQRKEKKNKEKGKTIDTVDPNTSRIATLRKNASEFFGSDRMRRATGGLASFLIAFAWVARIRSIRQELQQEQELRDLRQVQQREREREQQIITHREENGINVIDDGLLFTSDPLNILIPSPPRPALSCQRNRERIGTFAHDKFDVCPLCNEPRIHPTASVGGYVFCLKCILAFLRQNGAVCPLTRKHCPESSLVRLYEPNHST